MRTGSLLALQFFFVFWEVGWEWMVDGEDGLGSRMGRCGRMKVIILIWEI